MTFKISDTKLYYDGGDVGWNLISGFALEIVNQVEPDGTYDADIFEFKRGRVVEHSVTVSRSGGTGTVTLDDGVYIEEVTATPQASGDPGDPFPPFGITVKHMSKTGGGYVRFDWDTNKCAMHNVSQDTVVAATHEDYSNRDANYTFEQLVHLLGGTGTKAVISMTYAYSDNTRKFWKVVENPAGVLEVHLTSSLREADWFDVTTENGSTTISYEGKTLQAPTPLEALTLETGGTSLAVTQTSVEFPRPGLRP